MTDARQTGFSGGSRLSPDADEPRLLQMWLYPTARASEPPFLWLGCLPVLPPAAQKSDFRHIAVVRGASCR